MNPGRPIRILLVDEDEPFLTEIYRLLSARQQHWEIFLAIGGDAATLALRVQEFDAIVTDIGETAVSGADVLAAAASQRPQSRRLAFRQSGRVASRHAHEVLENARTSREIIDALERALGGHN